MKKRIADEETLRFTYYFIFALEKLESPKNKNKEHWFDQSLVYLNRRLEEEKTEFREAFMEGKSKEDMIDELKDIINLSLMIWDKLENTDTTDILFLKSLAENS
jgi:NTP pyrophosphatase (non-canonical NTP hydrolase)